MHIGNFVFLEQEADTTGVLTDDVVLALELVKPKNNSKRLVWNTKKAPRALLPMAAPWA